MESRPRYRDAQEAAALTVGWLFIVGRKRRIHAKVKDYDAVKLLTLGFVHRHDADARRFAGTAPKGAILPSPSAAMIDTPVRSSG